MQARHRAGDHEAVAARMQRLTAALRTIGAEPSDTTMQLWQSLSAAEDSAKRG
jgi:hypothetical protein